MWWFDEAERSPKRSAAERKKEKGKGREGKEMADALANALATVPYYL